MKKRNIITALVAASVTLTTTSLRADDSNSKEAASPANQYQTGQSEPHNSPSGTTAKTSKGAYLKASYIIGRPVQSNGGERLGKVEDIVVNLSSDTAPFCIVSSGGTLGIGATHVAVPLRDLRWLPDSDALALSASKAQFDSAATSPTAGWAAMSHEAWAKNIDHFYGQPVTASMSRFERQPMGESTEGAESVRNPSETKGDTGLLNGQNAPANSSAAPMGYDAGLVKGVNKVIKQDAGPSGATTIQSTIRNGVVTLTGSVTSQEEKQLLEEHIKALPGVEHVDDHLMIKNNSVPSVANRRERCAKDLSRPLS